MTKRLTITAVLLAALAAAALAAPMSGKVAAVKSPQVKVIASGKLAPWVKKGQKVSLLGGKGTITAVASDTVTINTPKAAAAKVGATITFDKVAATATGC